MVDAWRTILVVVVACLAGRIIILNDVDGYILMSDSATRTATFGSSSNENKGKRLLVLGGTGFLGQTICRRAALEGYKVTSLSRRGVPTTSSSDGKQQSISSVASIDYRKGDARDKNTIAQVLSEGNFCGVIHCIGILFDDASGFASFNRFASGSGSLPDSDSSYDAITRQSAFNAIDASIAYAKERGIDNFPFLFASAAEAGWTDVPGGKEFEQFLAPDFLRRYLAAKRSVESKLTESEPTLRGIIFRPSLIYSLDRPLSFPSVGAFWIGNRVGIPFLDRPVTVQALAYAFIRAIGLPGIRGVQRFNEIDKLNE
jgi:nucleoside-diphosphate-sugar epimerase